MNTSNLPSFSLSLVPSGRRDGLDSNAVLCIIFLLDGAALFVFPWLRTLPIQVMERFSYLPLKLYFPLGGLREDPVHPLEDHPLPML